MADPEPPGLSTNCQKPIKPFDEKMTINGVPYHMKCWNERTRGKPGAKDAP